MKKIFMLMFLVVIIPVVLLLLLFARSPQRFELTLKKPAKNAPVSLEPSGAAVGSSVSDDEIQAILEAVAKAKSGLKGKPHYAYVAFTVRYDAKKIHDELKKQLGDDVKIHGMTSSFGVMTNKGLHVGKTGSLAILLVSSPDIKFGVSGIDLDDFGSTQEAGKTAVLKALADAGKSTNDAPPDIILMSGTFVAGDEVKMLDGIAEVVGKETPVIGGNAGDETLTGIWKQMTGQAVYKKGLVLTAIYTDRKIGWEFESRFKVTDVSGIATKAKNNVIYEIDNKPALDVYDQWLGGGLYEKIEKLGYNEVVGYTARHPLARELRGDKGAMAFCCVHPAPTPADLAAKKLTLGTTIEEGSKIYLMASNWQAIISRSEKVPEEALRRGLIKSKDGEFGIFVVCTGMAMSVPPQERFKIPLLVNNVLGDIPFIGVFTHGEQGPVPGIRNINANLVESLVVIGKEAKEK